MNELYNYKVTRCVYLTVRRNDPEKGMKILQGSVSVKSGRSDPEFILNIHAFQKFSNQVAFMVSGSV